MNELDEEHRLAYQRAVRNILTSDLAEFTYAQILDGLPVERSLKEEFVDMHGHPVLELHHEHVCEGYREKARDFGAHFDPSKLLLDPPLLRAFQKAKHGSKEFSLRLVELVVVACHQIAADLYELDVGAHQHQVHQDWLKKLNLGLNDGAPHRYYYTPPRIAFSHRAYGFPERYPRGVSDVAGYWAEGQIFGGVVWFDRGDTEQEQLESLITFLLSNPGENPPCPLPIHGTPENRPRWDPYEALSRFHIFRDKNLLKPPAQPRGRTCTSVKAIDWPEVGDEMIWVQQNQLKDWGKPYDADLMAEIEDKMKLVTPSSPCWRPRPS